MLSYLDSWRNQEKFIRHFFLFFFFGLAVVSPFFFGREGEHTPVKWRGGMYQRGLFEALN